MEIGDVPGERGPGGQVRGKGQRHRFLEPGPDQRAEMVGHAGADPVQPAKRLSVCSPDDHRRDPNDPVPVSEDDGPHRGLASQVFEPRALPWPRLEHRPGRAVLDQAPPLGLAAGERLAGDFQQDA